MRSLLIAFLRIFCRHVCVCTHRSCTEGFQHYSSVYVTNYLSVHVTHWIVAEKAMVMIKYKSVNKMTMDLNYLAYTSLLWSLSCKETTRTQSMHTLS